VAWALTVTIFTPLLLPLIPPIYCLLILSLSAFIFLAYFQELTAFRWISRGQLMEIMQQDLLLAGCSSCHCRNRKKSLLADLLLSRIALHIGHCSQFPFPNFLFFLLSHHFLRMCRNWPTPSGVHCNLVTTHLLVLCWHQTYSYCHPFLSVGAVFYFSHRVFILLCFFVRMGFEPAIELIWINNRRCSKRCNIKKKMWCQWRVSNSNTIG